MANTAATLDDVWSRFETLSPLLRDRFIERLIQDDRFRQEIEDVLDLATASDRLDEPSRPLEHVLAEIDRQDG
jgi:hypothetical protein